MTEAPRLHTLGQVSMRAKDLARAVAFYRDALGLPLLFEVAEPEMAFFDMDGVRLMLATPHGPTNVLRVLMAGSPS